MSETRVCNTCRQEKDVSLFVKSKSRKYHICNECNAVYQRERRKKRREQTQVWYVYALIDPRDNAIRYVGQTFMLLTRVMDHMAEARSKGVNPAKTAWLNELAQSKLLPRMEVLEETTEAEINAREVHWIRHFKKQGHKLLNVRYSRF